MIAWLRRLFGFRARAAETGLERTPTGPGRERCDLRLCVPAAREHELTRGLARLVVRVADRARAEGDAYHLVQRLVDEPENLLLPLGPHLQTLGERLALELARTGLDRRTTLCLSLDHHLPLGDVVDATAFDPELESELESLAATPGIRWAIAATLARDPGRIRARLLLWLPTPAAATLESAHQRLLESFDE